MKKNKNIIIISRRPYSSRKGSHYYIKEFQSDGWHIEYWEINNILKYMKDVKYNNQKKEAFVRSFNNMNQLLDAIESYDAKNTIFINQISFNKSSIPILNILKKGNYKWVKIDYFINPISIIYKNKTYFEKIENLKFPEIVSLIKRKFAFLKTKTSVQNIPDILFVTGNLKNKQNKAKKNVSINYFDIEKYYDLQNTKSLLPNQYIVFLDIMLVNHPDFQILGYNKTTEKELYFNKLNAFFDKIEEQTKLPVVIASHPEANYTDEFRDRICIKNKTAELVIHSDLVLTHGSLSISYALLAKKPLLYIYSSKIFNTNNALRTIYDGIEVASNKLGSMTIDIDNYSINDKLLLDVNEKKYQQFLEKAYIASKQSEQKSNYVILKNNFTELLEKL